MTHDTESVLGAMRSLLAHPVATAGATTHDEGIAGARFVAGALVCLSAYGAAVGFFQGEGQIVIAALKVPVVVLGTAILCLPSFYVFTSLAGADLKAAQAVRLLAGFCAVVALLMAGMLPIAWLFSVSTKSILFVFWMHLLLWLAALSFALRYLGSVFSTPSQQRALRLWMILFVIVSFQMTTHLRPILWSSGDHVFTASKLTFVEHFRAMNAEAFAQRLAPASNAHVTRSD